MIIHWQVYALLSAFFAGLTAILAKVGVAQIPSNTATLIRTIVICIFLSILVVFKGEWVNPATLDRKSLIFLALSGIATGLSWLFYFRALQLGNVSQVAPIDKLSLAFAVVLSVIFLKEVLVLKQWVGVAMMIVGAVLLVK